MVTPEAVEAARKVMARGAYQMSNDELPYEHVARAALEAAAPHMRAAAWDEGKDAVWAFLGNQDPQRARPTNPYRTTDAR